MGYEIIKPPEGNIYHYTKKINLPGILKQGKICRFRDSECWFSRSLADILRIMEITVMREGQRYISTNLKVERYPKFIPEDYVVLKLEPENQNGIWVIWTDEVTPDCSVKVKQEIHDLNYLKIGFRGDLKFYPAPEVIEMTSLI